MLSKFNALRLFSFFVMFLLVGSSAFAEGTGLDLSSITIDTTPIFQLAGAIVAAIASIWAIKKVIKLGNRS